MGSGVVLPIRKTPLLKLSFGRERRLKFSKMRRVSCGGSFTKRYLRKFE